MAEDLGEFKAVQFIMECTEKLAKHIEVGGVVVDIETGVLEVKEKTKLKDGNYKIVAVPRFKV